jgi:hypothetical protein
MAKEILLPSKAFPQKNFQKVAFFSAPQNVVQLTRFTSKSPQLHHKTPRKKSHISQNPL